MSVQSSTSAPTKNLENDISRIFKNIINEVGAFNEETEHQNGECFSQQLSDIKAAYTEYFEKTQCPIFRLSRKLPYEETFCHEFGHCRQAINSEYSIVALALFGFFRTLVFYNYNGKIRYNSFWKLRKPGGAKGISFFDKENSKPDLEEFQEISFSGIIQEYEQAKKRHYLKRHCLISRKLMISMKKHFGTPKIKKYLKNKKKYGSDSFWAFFATNADINCFNDWARDLQHKIDNYASVKDADKEIKIIIKALD